jgi:photosystem II stability/assembly factor-like uncharacterized protein
MMRAAAMAALLALPVCAASAKLELRFFYDKNDSELDILQVQFVSAKRGLAIGVLQDRNGAKGRLLETNDGGETWKLLPFREIPRSLFFLDESVGWIATDRGVWRTEEGGREWKKVHSRKGILAVHFLDTNTGFAVGVPKLFLRTTDGGRKWTKVEEGDKPETKPEHTAYTVIGFTDARKGVVGGFSAPPDPRDSRVPDWMEPELARYRRQRPAVLILIETRDGGTTWKPAMASLFGKLTRLALAEREGLGIIEFDNTFAWPSEVYRFFIGSGKSERVFREKKHLITDAIWGKDSAMLAAIELPYEVRGAPIPGRVKILRSDGGEFKNWESVPVDYRATANRVTLSLGPDGVVWAVTDAGMILSLAP